MPDQNQSNNRFKLIHPSTASKILVFLLIIASLLVIVTMAVGLVARAKDLAKEDKYQAVFLTNGQVYFGKLAGANDNYLVLRDVYYLQNQESESQAGRQNQQTDQSNVQL